MVQELLGHSNVRTTIYTHVLNRGGKAVRSPADSLRLLTTQRPDETQVCVSPAGIRSGRRPSPVREST